MSEHGTSQTPPSGDRRVRIVVVTRAFPYPPGEQFVAPEAPFWGRDDAEVVVMPARIEGEQWAPLPPGVSIDRTLADLPRSLVQQYRARAVASPLLWRDLAFLVRTRRASRASIIEAMRAASGALLVRDALARHVQEHGRIDLVYGYWYDIWPMGAQLLRDRSGRRSVGRVVSRVHGYDLYEARQPGGFQGLKRQLVPTIDAVLPISQQGADYVVATYGARPEQIRLSRLGVELPAHMTPTSPTDELHVLSVALVSPVKRVDRLADAVTLLARRHPELRLHWTHIGGGDLLADVRGRVPTDLANLRTSFPGTLDSTGVREHLANQPADIFVNTSESEGVPVSIMEAMAHGVPTLAPRVGGIPELVPERGPGGQLLSEAPDADEVAEALWAWHERAKQPVERDAAHTIVAQRYDEQKNFRGLMDFLVQLARQ